MQRKNYEKLTVVKTPKTNDNNVKTVVEKAEKCDVRFESLMKCMLGRSPLVRTTTKEFPEHEKESRFLIFGIFKFTNINRLSIFDRFATKKQ